MGIPNFMRYKWWYFLISALVMVPGIISLVLYGLRPGIDFSGGSLMQYKIKLKIPALPAGRQNPKLKMEIEELARGKGVDIYSIQQSGDDVLLIRSKPIDKNQNEAIKKAISDEFGQVEELRFETLGPTLGRELLVKTLLAVGLAAVLIMLYVAWQFKNKMYGICAILAMFHDSLILLGSFSLLGHFYGVEVDTLFVTAVLTILSFSVHDTVVVYDRIREAGKKYPGLSFAQLINLSVAETVGRSLINSLTIIFMLMALFLLGGTTIKWFVLALLIGTITGTYSSTFTAAPLLVVWKQVFRGAQKQKR